MTRSEPRNFRVRISKPNQLTVTFSIVSVNSSDCVGIRSSPHFCIIILVPGWGHNYHGMKRSSRISRKNRIRNATIRQQIGLGETIIREIEQSQLTWYGHVQRMAEERLPKIALKWM